MTNLRKLIPEDELDVRMAAAKARSEWELGDASWAGLIVNAFLYPTEDTEALEMERA